VKLKTAPPVPDPGAAGGQGGGGSVGSELLWARQFGDDALQHGVTAARAGDDILLTGRFSGEVTFGATTLSSAPPLQEVFVAKLDEDGEGLFARSLGDTTGHDIETDPSGNTLVAFQTASSVDLGGGPLTGYSSTGLVKLAPNGDHLFSAVWDGMYPIVEVHPSFVTSDPSGNMILAGQFDATADLGGTAHATAGGFDFFLAKFDGAGTLAWSQSFGAASDQYVGDVTSDSQGNLLLAGDFLGTMSLGGSPLTAGAMPSLFIAKLDADGGHVFSKSFDTEVEPRMFVRTDSADNLVVAGTFFYDEPDFGDGPIAGFGESDGFVAKFDAAGTLLYARGLGGVAEDYVTGLVIDDDDNVIVTGTYQDTADFGDGEHTSVTVDQFVVKMGPNLETVWSRTYGGDVDDESDGVTVDSAGNVVVVSSTSGAIDFGGGELTSAGNLDLFVAKRVP
jgi:hypothetical protein